MSSVTVADACRACGAPLSETFCDLGASPRANDLLKFEDRARGERHYPLHALVCSSCYLVQLSGVHAPEEVFADYVYFSSFSESWLRHARRYVDAISARLALDENALVVEVASNDGYLLKNFVEAGVPCLGVEPSDTVAAEARRVGVPTDVAFFSASTAERIRSERGAATLTIANNVLAHVPDIHDFVAGFAVLLADDGVATFEFPHLLEQIQGGQFDTIYHEHVTYLSALALEPIFARHGLRLFDVERLPTHGGSLRLFVCRQSDDRPEEPAVAALRRDEAAGGLTDLETYRAFKQTALRVRRDTLRFFLEAGERGETVVGYGAAAKGVTLLNYCGVDQDFLQYVVDLNPHKQGRLIPGPHIPIYAPDRIFETKPDYIFILPWNLRDEIAQQLTRARDWGAKFVVPVPELEVF